MTQEDKIELKTLVADFMEQPYEIVHIKTKRIDRNVIIKKRTEDNNELYHLDYDTDWNLLMPVVEKIVSVPWNRENAFRNTKKVTDSLIYVDKDVIWLAVVEFIKWHNTTHP